MADVISASLEGRVLTHMQYLITGQVVINANLANQNPNFQVYQKGFCVGSYFCSHDINDPILDEVINLSERVLTDDSLYLNKTCMPMRNDYGLW